MPDYSNGKIYCIRSYQTDDVYIGSTTQKLCRRMTDHRRDYKNYMNDKHHYLTSFDIIKLGDAYIELIENYPCSCREELHKKEGMYVRKMKCVNKNIPGRTKNNIMKIIKIILKKGGRIIKIKLQKNGKNTMRKIKISLLKNKENTIR